MDNNQETVSYTVYEAAQARSDRRFKQMWITVLVLIVLLVGTNMGWLIHESQYEDVVTTISQNAVSDSGDAVINGDKAGSVNYGCESEPNGNN